MTTELKCKHCSRHLGWSYGTIVAEIKCPSCKATNQYKQIQADTIADIRFKFAKPEQPPKKKEGVPLIGEDGPHPLEPEVS